MKVQKTAIITVLSNNYRIGLTIDGIKNYYRLGVELKNNL